MFLCEVAKSQIQDFSPIRNLFCYWPQISELDGSLGPLTKWDTENIDFIKNKLNKMEKQNKQYVTRKKKISRGTEVGTL
jgi:hypothetical protein